MEQMKSYSINTQVPLDENGQNTNIKFHIREVPIMEECTFRFMKDFWILSREVTPEICISIKIYNDEHGEINCIDTYFGQPYDFQAMIINKTGYIPNTAILVQCMLYKILYSLKEHGIIEGWNWGDYI